MMGFSLWLAQDTAVCLTHSHHSSKHFHFSFCFSSPSTLYLSFRKKTCTAQHEPKNAGGAYHKWSLSHCPPALGPVPCAAPPAPSSIHHPWLLRAAAQKPNLVSVCETGGGSYTQKPIVHLTTPIWMETSQNLRGDFVQGLFLWWKCNHIMIPAKSPFWDRAVWKATLILEDSNHWLQLFITFTSHRVVRNRKQYCSFSCQLSPPPILHFNEELNLK